MTLDTIANISSALGIIIASIALILNFLQFRRLEKSIKGNTYQQLAQYALKIKEILLEHPDIQYLYTMAGDEKRSQEIFNRLIGNYLEDMWFQRKYGLIDEEMWKAYDELVRQIVASHPRIVTHMLQPNFASSLREYIQSIAQETHHSSSVSR